MCDGMSACNEESAHGAASQSRRILPLKVCISLQDCAYVGRLGLSGCDGTDFLRDGCPDCVGDDPLT